MMYRLGKQLALAMLTLPLGTVASSQAIPAFPGAEGAGATASGGRGMQVYHVTNLDPSGPGSFVDALKGSNRIVVFDVSGVINLNTPDPDAGRNDHWFRTGASNITIAGQTAPGDGIVIAGTGTKLTGTNVILRNVHFRTGKGWNTDPNRTMDAVWLQAKDSIVDHVSAAWASDEGISTSDAAANTTVQYSIAAEGLMDHSYGALVQVDTPDTVLTYHHNLFTSNRSRNPRLGNKTGAQNSTDFRNNVIYNWGNLAGYSGRNEEGDGNIIGNYFVAGPSTSSGARNQAFEGDGTVTGIYQSGNKIDGDRDGSFDGTDTGWAMFTGTYTKLNAPLNVPSVTTQTADDALDTVLDFAGANWWNRTTTDARVVGDVRSAGTQGKLIYSPSEVGGVPTEVEVYRAADWDVDLDGMPGYWELEHGLDPEVANSGADFDSDGYTDIEEYLNDLAAWPAPKAITFTGTTNGRYAQITNWDIPWQPSRFDTAVIDHGTVEIDAVGQHAGNLLLGTSAGANPTLNVTSGWIKVEDADHGLSDGRTVVGGDAAATATLNLSGGRLSTKLLEKGDAGTFNFTGGMLSADMVGFSLANNGGVLAPGSSIGTTEVEGDLTMNAGALEIELASPSASDRVNVSGTFTLGGELTIALLDGFEPAGESWVIATATSYTGSFDSITPGFAVSQLDGLLVLSAVAGLEGDYNEDGKVDLADYTVWRDHLGEEPGTLPNDTSGEPIGPVQYATWKSRFGASSASGVLSSKATVPEPTTLFTLLTLLGGCIMFRWKLPGDRPKLATFSIAIRRSYGALCFLVLATVGATTACQFSMGQIPAFPGADGAGAFAEGGRGGIVYHVTRLESAIDDPDRNAPGTIRWGLNNSNFPAGVPRTIVFDVGGVFNLGRLPQSGWDPNGNGWDAQSRLTIGGTKVTLAGQTAPGAGVIFMGGGLKPQGDNNVIRNITVASGYGTRGWWKPGEDFPDYPVPAPSTLGPGIYPDATVYDAMDISATNLMIDHVTTLYATDETISMNEASENITIQYSNISQSQNYPQWDAEGGGFTGHALGSLLEAGDGAAISFHHNLYAHHKSRVPQAQGGNGFYDFRNNVFYNWLGTAGVSSGSTRLNLVGNFYLAGNGGDNPVGGNSTALTTANGGTSVVVDTGSVYKQGNLIDSNKDGDANDGVPATGSAPGPYWSGGTVTYRGTTDSAEDAYDRVLDYVGANWWTRDGVIDTPDERIINEVRTGTGRIEAWADDPWDNDPNEGLEWRNLKNTPQVTRAADWDVESDIGYGVGDGMPTYWEVAHELDPNLRDDTGDFDNDGYTNLEEYLNEVAAWPAPNAIVFDNGNGDGRFAHIRNWDANPAASAVHNWQPSRFDTAVIDNGTVAVDAVGQHAGNLLLATNAGDSATLNISDGWLKVEDAPHGMSDGTLVIADHPDATATLNLTGGALRTQVLLKGAGGTFNFTGGVLSAETVGFDLVNNGGTLAPGQSIGVTEILGDFDLLAGTLDIDLASPTEADRVDVMGMFTLGGALTVSLLDGFEPAGESWVIATATSYTRSFDSITPGFAVSQMDGLLVLSAVAGLEGDYNNDGKVDLADYTVWRDHLGEEPGTLPNDPSGEPIGAVQYDSWKTNFGATVESAISKAAVPEPAGACLLAAAVAVVLLRRTATGFQRRN